MLELGLVAGEVDVRTVFENEGVAIVVRITAWGEHMRNNNFSTNVGNQQLNCWLVGVDKWQKILELKAPMLFGIQRKSIRPKLVGVPYEIKNRTPNVPPMHTQPHLVYRELWVPGVSS